MEKVIFILEIDFLTKLYDLLQKYQHQKCIVIL